MQSTEKTEHIERLKVLAINLAKLYNSNIELKIDVNVKIQQVKVKITEAV